MEFKLDRQDNSYGLLTVTVSNGDFMPTFKTKLKEYAQQANFKGFRQGKVPTSMIQKMYGKDLKMDAFNQAVGTGVDNYLKENNVKSLFQPVYKGDFITPEQLTSKTESYTLEFELVIPEVTFSPSEDIAVKNYNLEVSDADIENTIEKLKTSYPTKVDVEEVAMNDTLTADFKAAEGEFSKEGVALELKEGKVSQEIADKLIGKKKNGQLTFDIEKLYEDEKRLRLLFGGDQEAAEAYTGKFKMVIKGIQRDQEPEMNQEFFDQIVGPEKVSNEEEFKAELRNLITEANNQAIDSVFSTNLRKAVLDSVDITFNEELLKKIYVQSQKETPTEEQITEKLPEFTEAVKWRAVSDKVMEEGEIKVDHKEVEAKAKEQLRAQFAQFGGGMIDDEQLDQYAVNYLSMENGKYFEQMFDQVMTDKVYDYIKSKVTTVEETVDLAQFENIMKEMNEAN